MDLRLTGKTALVTGASQGIGEGVARTLAAEGVNIHITARSADRLEQLRKEILAEYSVGVHSHPLDITEAGAEARLVEAVGDIDILVNNAGAIPSGTMFDVDEENWRAGWNLKVFGYINLCRLVYPRLKARGGGVIVNNIGNGGEVFDPRYIAGVTGNAGLMAFTKALGGASLDDNIRVVGVNPGPVDTDRIYKMLKKRAHSIYGDESRYMELAANYPLGRPAHREEVVDTIVFLASERSGYTTGTIVTIDGGVSSRRSII